MIESYNALREVRRGAPKQRVRRKEPIMFKILELRGADSAAAAQVGRGYSARQEALAAVKAHLKTFKASGHNLEGNYWWVRDSAGLRKCWISSID